MYLKNINENKSKTINVDGLPISYNCYRQFDDDFKKTQEYKNLLTLKFVEVYTDNEYRKILEDNKKN